jgi:hypothetical protein
MVKGLTDMNNPPTGHIVVVVDDDPLVAQLLQDTLEDAGFGVIVALSYETRWRCWRLAPARSPGC